MVHYPRDNPVKQPHVELEQFISITYSPDDITVICPQEAELPGAQLISNQWRVVQIKGAYDADSAKVVAELSRVLRRAEVKMFVASAFDTDYVLVADAQTAQARQAIQEAGFALEEKRFLSA